MLNHSVNKLRECNMTKFVTACLAAHMTSERENEKLFLMHCQGYDEPLQHFSRALNVHVYRG